MTCQWLWEQKPLKISVCFSVTWKYRTTKSLPRQPGLLSIVTCFHLSNKCCQFLRFVTDSASLSFHLMMWLTAPSQNCLIDDWASFLTPLSTQCGENVSDPFCLQRTLEQRLFSVSLPLVTELVYPSLCVSNCFPPDLIRYSYFFSDVQVWILDFILFFIYRLKIYIKIVCIYIYTHTHCIYIHIIYI